LLQLSQRRTTSTLHDNSGVSLLQKREVFAEATIAELQYRPLSLTKVSDDMSMSELQILYHWMLAEEGLERDVLHDNSVQTVLPFSTTPANVLIGLI
jgi:hypothetical protein